MKSKIINKNLIFLMLIISIVILNIAITLSLVTDEHIKESDLIRFDKVAILADGKGSKLSIIMDNVTGNNEIVFDRNLDSDQYFMIQTAEDTSPCFIRFKMYYSLGDENLDEMYYSQLNMLNDENFIYEGLTLYNCNDYSYTYQNGWFYLTLEENDETLKVGGVENARTFILSEKYVLHMDENNIDSIIELGNNFEIKLIVKVEAIQTEGLKNLINEEVFESNDILNSKVEELNYQEIYGGATIRDFEQAQFEQELAEDEYRADVLDARFVKDGCFDYSKAKYLKKYGDINNKNVISYDETINAYACTFKIENKGFYRADGFSDYHEDLKKSFTLESLFKFNLPTSSEIQHVFSSTAAGGFGVRISPSNPGNIEFIILDKKYGEYTIINTPVSYGNYIHYAVTFDGKNAKLYINGTFVTSKIINNFQFSEDETVNWYCLGGDVNTGDMADLFANTTLSYLKIYSQVIPEDIILEHSMENLTLDLMDITCKDNGFYDGITDTKLLYLKNDTIEVKESGMMYDEELKTNVYKFVSVEQTCFRFDNYMNYYSILKQGFTMSMKFKMHQYTASSNPQKVATNLNVGGFGIEFYPNTMTYKIMAHNGSSYSYSSACSYKNDEYMDMYLTYDGITMKLYVNGSFVKSLNIDNLVMPTANNQKWFAVGADSGVTTGDAYADCTLAYVKMYTRTLSANQIALLCK